MTSPCDHGREWSSHSGASAAATNTNAAPAAASSYDDPLTQYRVEVPFVPHASSSVAGKSYHTPHTSGLAPSPPPPRSVKMAKRACIPCRKLKASCDDTRPCRRCVKFDRECFDRTEEEYPTRRPPPSDSGTVCGCTCAAALKAKSTKRTVRDEDAAQAAAAASALSPDPTPVPPSVPILPTAAEFDVIARRLYSQSYLSVLVQSGIRDLVLKLHTTLDQLPLDLPNLLEWQVQNAVMCSSFAGQLLPDDFSAWLTHDLTPQQLESPAWLSSPLAAWSRCSTRPLFLAITPTDPRTHQQPTPLNSFSLPQQQQAQPYANDSQSIDHDPTVSSATPNGGASASPPVAGSNEPLILRIEWLPIANSNFARWTKMLVTRLLFERQLRADRNRADKERTTARAAASLQHQQQPPSSHPLQPSTPLASPSSSLHSNGMDVTTHFESLPPLPMSAFVDHVDSALPVQPIGMDFGAPVTPATPASGASASACDSVPANMTAELAGLEHTFSLLDVSHALSASPAIEQDCDILLAPLHANWCPEAHADETRGDKHGAKLPRWDGMASIAHVTSHGLPSSSCICQLSTPLPARVTVNPAFERTFGWTCGEVERAFRAEGMLFFRQLYIPSAWPIGQSNEVEHWKSQIKYVGEMAILAAHAADGLEMPALESVEQPLPLLPQHERLRTKHGTLDPYVWRQTLQVQLADGANRPSSLTCTWHRLELAAPQPMP